MVLEIVSPELFQSTHSCRVRLNYLKSLFPLVYFNPRTRVECDFTLLAIFCLRPKFQSTHSCRVRPITTLSMFASLKFQSTHSCRVRLLILCGSYPISTLHKRNSEDILYIIQINNPFLARLTRLFMLNTGSLQ